MKITWIIEYLIQPKVAGLGKTKTLVQPLYPSEI